MILIIQIISSPLLILRRIGRVSETNKLVATNWGPLNPNVVTLSPIELVEAWSERLPKLCVISRNSRRAASP